MAREVGIPSGPSATTLMTPWLPANVDGTVTVGSQKAPRPVCWTDGIRSVQLAAAVSFPSVALNNHVVVGWVEVLFRFC